MPAALTIDLQKSALPLTLIVVGVGMIGWMIVAGGTLAYGWPVALFVLALFAIASWVTPASLAKLMFGNLLVIVILVVGTSSLCTSRCGEMPFYDSMIGIPTWLWGVLVHSTMFAIGALMPRLPLSAIVLRWSYLGMLAVAVGATLFYLLVMLKTQHWCPTCAAAHMITLTMAAEGVRLLWRHRAEQVQLVLAMIAAAGLINATFHHEAHDVVRNQPERLLSWLSGSERNTTIPLGLISSPSSEPTAAKTAADEQLDAVSVRLVEQAGNQSASPSQERRSVTTRQNLAAEVDTNLRTRTLKPSADREGALPTTPAKATDKVSPAAVAAPHLGVWGRPEAPIKLVAALDPGCAYCEQALLSILECKDLIEAKDGPLTVDFALNYGERGERPDFGQQTACYLIYAAGTLGQGELVSTMRAVMSGVGRTILQEIASAASRAQSQGRVVQEDADVRNALARLYQLLPDGIDRKRLGQALQSHRAAIADKLANTITRMGEYGIQTTPSLWFYRQSTPGTQPFVIFRGQKEAAVIRYTVSQGLKDQPK